MISKIDKRALTQWNKSNISFQNYKSYIEKKTNKFTLTFIDLLYIANFKGGNATINELESEIDFKLKSYSKIILSIDNAFKTKELAKLNSKQIEKLNSFVDDISSLTLDSSENKIDGFSVSRISALLNAYFPNLIPILDRRVLINLELVSSQHRDSQDQIKNIQKFFTPLIIKIAQISKSSNKPIREIDKKIFSQKIEKPKP